MNNSTKTAMAILSAYFLVFIVGRFPDTQWPMWYTFSMPTIGLVVFLVLDFVMRKYNAGTTEENHWQTTAMWMLFWLPMLFWIPKMLREAREKYEYIEMATRAIPTPGDGAAN